MNVLPYWTGVVLALIAAPHAIESAQADAWPDNAEYFSWDGYRVLHYRSPTPNHAEGGQRINTAQVRTLMKNRSPALLNVQPVAWQHGIFLQTAPHYQLPGSTWLPNVGQGELTDRWREYFQRGLHDLSQGNRHHPIVVYCTADCWMSWNAVKRAATWGYTQLYWYAEGIDGWQQAGYTLDVAVPVALEK
ncbi:rhodanese-like domain-containing protein [Marinobacterium weihaiense]|uniref:Rhodanese domain-containing protein n=1 Tax=Marinobacterium weihaiense TaxID=2851016 RepID=A0ABS6M6F6_9GAMM|nr:rhodanese-like domain-containing protein [Marinobacterium weihaiense]MBV0931859.1 hypothetical protein [Marinobacterium weihaiense]